MMGDDQPIRDRLDYPVLALSRESLVRAGLITTCREWTDISVRCDQPAEFVLWGKLLPPTALGPRCYDHAVAHTHWTMPARSDQWAVIDLRQIQGRLAACPGACIPDDGVVDTNCPVHGRPS